MLAAAVVLAAAHFAAIANTTYALEWAADASTKTMIVDLRAVTSGRPPGSHVVLGIEPLYAPVAAYYARRTAHPIVDVVPPSAAGLEFFYGVERGMPGGMHAIARYPATGTVLAAAR
jgi:hypothetical protein